MERVGAWQSKEVVDAVVIWFARQWAQIAMELLRQGDVWVLELARNPMFSRMKWLQASMGGTWFVRGVRLLLHLALGWSPLPALRGGDLWKIQRAVPLRLVIQACSLHWNGCSDASSRRSLECRNRTTPYVSSHKVAPGVDGGNVCDGCGFYFIWRSTGPHCRRCAEVTFERFNALYHCSLVIQAGSLHWNGCSDASSRWCLGVGTARNPLFSRMKWFQASMGVTWFVRGVRLLSFGARVVPIASAARRWSLKDSTRCAIAFGWQFALEWLQRRVVKVMFGC